jgi:hypothetical protein
VSVFFDGPGHLKDATHVEPIFYKPRHLMLEPDGRLLVADEGNRCVWRIDNSRVADRLLGKTVYNQGYIDGDRSVSKNGVVTGMAYGKDATLYFSDASNQCVRKLSPAGAVTTLIGDGKTGNILGIATEARLKSIEGMVVGLDGNLYLADAGNYRILKLSPI